MPFTQAQVDTLTTAIAESGNAAEVRFADGSSVRYLSSADALAMLRAMQAEVQSAAAAAAAQAGGRIAPRAFRASSNPGW